MQDVRNLLRCSGRGVFNLSAGSQTRKSLREWAFPPDPSSNHNVACDLRHGGTTRWFFQGSMFDEWKLTGSLLWIHGKRMFLQIFNNQLLIAVYNLSGLWEDHPLVRHRLAFYILMCS